MKKIFLFAVATFGLSSICMADIVVKGTHVGNTVLFGTITVNCQNSDNECARIRTSAISGYDVNVPDMDPSNFHCESYSIDETSDKRTLTFSDCAY